MKAMMLEKICDLKSESWPLRMQEIPRPVPGAEEILIRVHCCGVCHTELDEIEGRTPPLTFPVVPGHQVIGIVEERGSDAKRFSIGDRVGVAWIYSACGVCEFCKQGLENLCKHFKATGRDVNGGYAEFITVSENFAFAVPTLFTDAQAAPLLCAGAIGYRSLMLAKLKNGEPLGLSGFGASAHLVLMMSKYLYPDSKIIVFARSEEERAFAVSLGAYWTGSFETSPPFLLKAVIDTTPAWFPVVRSLFHLQAGGRLVINAIRKEGNDKNALQLIQYPQYLWHEKEIKSVANITRKDVEEFLELASQIPIKPEIELYSFREANRALLDLQNMHGTGAKVLVMD